MSTLDQFPTEATQILDADIMHLKRGTGVNSDKFINGANVKAVLGKSIIIENPVLNDDLSYFFISVPITVTKIRAVLVGSATPSVTWTIRHGVDRSAAGAEVVTGGTVTTGVTTGSDITAFDDATIIADSWVWIEITAQSGTVGSIIVTLFYDED